MTIYEPAESVMPWPEPDVEQLQALREACALLDTVPSFNSTLEYEPRPDFASAEDSIRLAQRFEDPLTRGLNLIFDTEADQTLFGKWIVQDLGDLRDAGSTLRGWAEDWLRDADSQIFSYWVSAFRHVQYKAQETSGCGYLQELGE